MARFLLRILVLAVIIGAVAKLVSGIHVYGGFGALLWIALLFSIINAILGPVLKLLSLPFIILTLGLFLLVVNALMLMLTSALSNSLGIGFHVAGFWPAFWGSIVISLVSTVLSIVLADAPAQPRADG